MGIYAQHYCQTEASTILVHGVSRKGERPKTMLDGTAAGMVTGKQLQEELVRKKEADRKRLAALDASVTGRYAKTVSSTFARLMSVTCELPRWLWWLQHCT